MLTQIFFRKIFIVLTFLTLASSMVSAAEVKLEDLKQDEVVQEAIQNVESSEKSAIISTPKKEAEIPLNLGANKKAAESEHPIFRLLFSVSILGILGCGAFFLIKKKAIPSQLKHQTQIKVLQQHYLGPKKSLAIVRVAGESILIGVTDNNITHIKTLSLLDDELPQEIPQDFSKVVKGLDREADFVEAAEARNQQYEVQDDEDFSFGGIREAVSKKLKNMRNLE